MARHGARRARAGRRRRGRAAVVVDRAGGVPVAVPAAARGDRACSGSWPPATPTSRPRSSTSWASTGSAADQVLDALEHAEDSRRAASVIGLVGLLWAGLGVVGTLEQALERHLAGQGPPGLEGQAGRPRVAGRRRPAVLRLDDARARGAGELPGPAVVPHRGARRWSSTSCCSCGCSAPSPTCRCRGGPPARRRWRAASGSRSSSSSGPCTSPGR